MEPTFTVINPKKNRLPSIPFRRYKEKILGKRFILTTIWVSRSESQRLNKKYRKKNKPASILTFPLEKKKGEIMLNGEEIKRSAHVFQITNRKMLALVFIHGLLHLKGIPDGSTMRKEETRWLNNLYEI